MKNKPKVLRCIHRHTIEEHPKCFRDGKLLYPTKYFKRMSKPAKILLYDIETTPILAFVWGIWEQKVLPENVVQDWHLLSWSAKWLFSPDTMSDVLTPEEAINHNDYRITNSIWNLLEEADIVVTHNGDKFDNKRLNTRFLFNGLPPVSHYQSVDTLKVARSSFNFSSNRLDYINKTLGIPTKEDVDYDLWIAAYRGDNEALQTLLHYNENDVFILEDLYLRFRPYIKGHPNLNLWSEEVISVCPNCGSPDLDWNGHYYTVTGRYKSFRCQNCNAIGRSRYHDLEPKKRKSVVRG